MQEPVVMFVVGENRWISGLVYLDVKRFDLGNDKNQGFEKKAWFLYDRDVKMWRQDKQGGHVIASLFAGWIRRS